MVWILIAGTEYFHVPALCWVMFVAILFWVLTIFLFIIYLIGAHKRMPRVPWNTVVIHTHTCVYISLASLLQDSSGLESEPQPKTQKPNSILFMNPHAKPSTLTPLRCVTSGQKLL